MGQIVRVIGHNTISEVDMSTVAMHEQATPTSRLLAGSSDSWAEAEYVQPCTLPDGTAGTAVYLLDASDMQDTAGDRIEDEGDYDWDRSLSRIVIKQ